MERPGKGEEHTDFVSILKRMSDLITKSKAVTLHLARVGLIPIAARKFRHYYGLPYIFSFLSYFFPWTSRFAPRMARLQWLQQSGFRLYTGIDVMVAEPTAHRLESPM